MKYLKSQILLDFKLLHRNNLFILAALVGLIYIGIFYLLAPLGDLTTIVVILIFNDPVVTGYLFAAVLLLFDKNQNTLQAFSVLPVPFYIYLISKVILLSCLATVIAFIMAFATQGLDFNPIHLFSATFFSTFIFSCCGFIISARVNSFNQLLLYSLPVFILSAIPFLSIFDFGNMLYYIVIPSWGGVNLMKEAFDPHSTAMVIIFYVHLVTFSFLFWKLTVREITNIKL